MMVLDAAAELLATHRLEEVSMAAIARRAGMSKRTLYTVFSCREELLGASFARIGQTLFRRLTEVERQQPLAERLRTLLTLNHVPCFEETPLELLRAVVTEAPVFPGIARQLDTEGRGALIRYVGEELTAAAAEGEADLKGMRAEDAAELLVDMVIGDTLHRLLIPEDSCSTPAERDLRRDRAIALFLDGVRPR
ncbi:TetR/AcrR family transcriptional regulator [Salipiger sp. P9]|uniref:TetR/AcrR family transcriptional regulator n=1 Tax=Salipiger pentaromativorans TaxID=2943193 RepID=UPI00215748E5|nr:TetR/AcrR family transcriptional regulator [Salipiger pentaromativorans]MCR8547888.1 TetR/AcrR family transcriptional regulator [Salipiger pentaromativorans]